MSHLPYVPQNLPAIKGGEKRHLHGELQNISNAAVRTSEQLEALSDSFDAHTHTVDELSDVAAAAPAEGDVLRFVTDAWVKSTDLTDAETAIGDLETAVGAIVEPADILTTRGDIIVRGASAPERLAVGSVDQILTSDGTDPVWSTPAAPPPAIPIGTVVDYAGASAPTDWLFCYGQAISRTTYADLFTAISDTFGVGDGTTTFNLPDLRGRVIAGKDDMGGTSADRLTGTSGGVDGDVLGNVGGAQTHALTIGQIPAHTHSYQAPIGSSTAAVGAGLPSTIGGTTGSAGGNGSHNNVQPTIILNKIIKAL